MIKIMLLAAAVLAPTTSTGISGIRMADQWGRPWVSIDAVPDGTSIAIVSVFDCLGKAHSIGTVPIASLGSENSFAGFRPYKTASMSDWMVIYVQSAWEKRCIKNSREGKSCAPNPERDDCEVVTRPNGHSLSVPKEVWEPYLKAHGGRPF